eukprot:scaffold95752_cov27-Tisochrysis_lutea.AAC.2
MEPRERIYVRMSLPITRPDDAIEHAQDQPAEVEARRVILHVRRLEQHLPAGDALWHGMVQLRPRSERAHSLPRGNKAAPPADERRGLRCRAYPARPVEREGAAECRRLRCERRALGLRPRAAALAAEPVKELEAEGKRRSRFVRRPLQQRPERLRQPVELGGRRGGALHRRAWGRAGGSPLYYSFYSSKVLCVAPRLFWEA